MPQEQKPSGLSLCSAMMLAKVKLKQPPSVTALAMGLDIAARSGDIDSEVGRVRRGLVGRDDPEVGDTIKGEVGSMRDSILVYDLSGFNYINNIHRTLASMHRILIEVIHSYSPSPCLLNYSVFHVLCKVSQVNRKVYKCARS